MLQLRCKEAEGVLQLFSKAGIIYQHWMRQIPLIEWWGGWIQLLGGRVSNRIHTWFWVEVSSRKWDRNALWNPSPPHLVSQTHRYLHHTKNPRVGWKENWQESFLFGGNENSRKRKTKHTFSYRISLTQIHSDLNIQIFDLSGAHQTWIMAEWRPKWRLMMLYH